MTGHDARDWNDLPAWIKVYMSEKAFLDEDRPGRGPSGIGPDDPGGADFGGSWQLFDESVPRTTPKSATWRISWLVADADQSHEVYATNRSEVPLFGTLHPCSRCVSCSWFNVACTHHTRGGGAVVALTQSQMVAAVADRAEMSRAEAKRALDALDEVVLDELGNAQKVRVGGLVQLTVRVKPAQKKRKGRNPATGEEIEIAAKPASVDVRARPLAKAKGALPSVQKARRRLAASNGRASR